MIVTALVVVPIVIGLALYATPRNGVGVHRTLGALLGGLALIVAAASPHAPDASLHWLARPFDAAFHLGFGPVSYWLVLLLALVTFSGALTLRGRDSRALAAQLLVLQGTMTGVFLAKDLL
ncbi:MAG: hypothetical protein JOZ24_10875, partial [Candidatus Eremiobacteraeota bacterium]|nr:hypothetical protein [Candidatus Eremiobacteraeota bacterium]